MLNPKKTAEAYQWLFDALRPHCDRIETQFSDYDGRYQVGVWWGETATGLVLEDSRPRGQIGVNALIAAGALSRADVVLQILSKKPGGVPAVMGVQ